MSISQNPTAAPALPAGGIMLSRPVPSGPVMPASITPADVWRVIKSRRLLILITICIVNAVGIPFSFAWKAWWPRWPGVALLDVKFPVVPEALAARRATPKDLIEIFQRSEAQAIQSRPFAEDLLEDSEIRQTKWYRKDEANALARFERQLSVTPIRNSSVIQVSFQTRDPEEAPRIVNKLVRIYLAARKQSATADLEQQLSSLRSQQATLRGNLRVMTDNIDRFVEAENIDVVRMRNTEAEAELGRFIIVRSELEMANEAAKAGLDTLSRQSPETWVPGAAQAYRIDNDPAIRTLKAYLLDLEERKEVQSKRLGPDHMFLKRLEDSIRVANRDLQTKLAEVRARVFAETLQEYQNAVTANEKTLDQIQAGIDEARAQMQELNPKILEYRGMENERLALDKFITVVEDRIHTTLATIEQHRGDVSGQVVPLAMASPSPIISSPRLKVNILATAFLSVMIGLGLAFTLEYMNKSLRSSLDVRRHTDLTFLGSIPALQEDEANPEDMYSVVMQAPRSLMAEAFRQVRTNLLFYCSRENARSILVTSPSPEDGRTCIAVNLATSIAMSGMKVLLIDANFSKPALSRLFVGLPEVGFADLLLRRVSIDQAVAASPVRGLSLMSVGQVPHDNTDLFGKSVMRGVIDKLAERFDQIILDGPPALVTAYALDMAGQVDGVLFIARAGKNSRGELNRMRDEISRLNSHIHGVVLNGVQATSGGYLRKSYQQFYDYHHPEVLPTTAGALPEAPDQPPTPPQDT